MPNEQPESGSEASVMDRLAANLGGAAEPAETAPEPTPEQPAEALEAEAQTETPPEDDGFDWETDDGEVLRLPAKVKEAVLRTQDYTKKTQEAATLRKQAEDRVMFADAREAMSRHLSAEQEALNGTRYQLQQLQALDYSQLYNENPGQAMQLMQRMNLLQGELKTKQDALNAKGAQFADSLRKHVGTQWDMAVKGVSERLGNVTGADSVGMLKQVQDLGFTVDEFRSRFADPRVLHMVYKAMKWDSSQASKPGVVGKAQAAPPVLKPGASLGPGVAAEQRYTDARAKLKKTGSLQDAAALFRNRM